MLALDPGARFGNGGLPGMVPRPVVLISDAASLLDLRVIRTLAAELGYEMHLSGSAMGARRSARTSAWFVPETTPTPPCGETADTLQEPVEPLMA